MGKQREGSLQERIQKYIKSIGGICHKNHGDMISEPGIPDISVGYKGLYIGIEAKVDGNTPSRQQGINCRNLWKAGNIAFVAWNLETVKLVFSFIDRWINADCTPIQIRNGVETQMILAGIDDGRKW